MMRISSSDACLLMNYDHQALLRREAHDEHPVLVGAILDE